MSGNIIWDLSKQVKGRVDNVLIILFDARVGFSSHAMVLQFVPCLHSSPSGLLAPDASNRLFYEWAIWSSAASSIEGKYSVILGHF